MTTLEIDWFFTHVDGASGWLHILTIPVFTGVIGWLINWSGLWMLFAPERFHGVRVPGLKQLARVLPRKVQEIPGLLEGGVGWQGIVPARAAKMGSIAVDKVIAKVGTPKDFYEQLEPEKIAEHIVDVFRPDLPAADRRDHAPRAPAAVARPARPGAGRPSSRGSRPSCPRWSRNITEEIGQHIDQLLDPKIMVIEHFRAEPRPGRLDLP